MKTDVALFLAALICTSFLMKEAALAKSDHYVVSPFMDANGYAEIDVSGGVVSGRICAFKDYEMDQPSMPRSILGVVNVQGQQNGNIINLQLSTDSSELQKMQLPKTVKLFRRNGSVYSDAVDLFPRSKSLAWETSENEERAVSFSKIPNTISAPLSDRYANILIKEKEEKFDLKKFDHMNPEEALSFVLNANWQWDDIVSPSFVNVVYKPENRDLIAKYVKDISGAAFLTAPPVPDCGSPFVTDFIQVPPMLEFYFARQLQTSGLVARAYPDVQYKTPPFEVLTLQTSALVPDIKNSSLSIEKRDSLIARFFERELKAFLQAKRPSFARESWEIERRDSGLPLAYRAKVTGALISQCQTGGWEQFDIQILPILAKGWSEIYVQVVAGFEAPGSLSQRPPDPRFKDNALSDERLKTIQDSFVNFLLKKGIADDEYSDPPAPEIACHL